MRLAESFEIEKSSPRAVPAQHSRPSSRHANEVTSPAVPRSMLFHVLPRSTVRLTEPPTPTSEPYKYPVSLSTTNIPIDGSPPNSVASTFLQFLPPSSVTNNP